MNQSIEITRYDGIKNTKTHEGTERLWFVFGFVHGNDPIGASRIKSLHDHKGTLLVGISEEIDFLTKTFILRGWEEVNESAESVQFETYMPAS